MTKGNNLRSHFTASTVDLELARLLVPLIKPLLIAIDESRNQTSRVEQSQPQAAIRKPESFAPQAPKEEHLDRLIRKREVLQIVPMATSTLYKKINDGTFPAPVKLGQRTIAWRLSEIREWQNKLASRRRTAPEPPPYSQSD